MSDEYDHHDFDIIRTDSRFGIFEELSLKDKSTVSISNCSFSFRAELEKHVMTDGCYGTIYPMYTHEGRKWVLMSFTYMESGRPVEKVLLWAERIDSRESLGIWRVDGKAWKVFRTTDQLEKLRDMYRRAEVGELPMGRPKFVQGTVQQGSNRPTQGFVLMVNWMTGTYFHLPTKQLNVALKAEKISHSKSARDYIRIKFGCEAALSLRLNDCQGYVENYASEPIAFIDVHLSTSTMAEALVDDIVEWGTQP
ncbi:hypothetical protein AMATHDRAFT_200193 [Amanita thiersii Skay4041]|uniref:Uncharacterized protein n=1 Tax=Amanita thiersii Skay4041 TaxID=703135 RepID=A0A2A9N6T8_9AGAR|nr:hypothetical protein AMATHDRAFT_200193 [Amanita thiersii Skay4041]